MLAALSARSTLSSIAHTAAGSEDPSPARPPASTRDRTLLAAWLGTHDLGAPGYAWARSNDPELASMLREVALGGAAGNLAHFVILDRIERRFETDRIPMVLLKGAAVAGSAYRDPSYRPMTDLDIWVGEQDVDRAIWAIRELGFREVAGLPHRPPALQRRSSGEIIFRPSSGEHGLVELHYGAFQGWWARRAARPDAAAVWRRVEPMGPGRHAHRLATEDAILQTAFHVVVNQFGQAPWRLMMDLAVLARAYPVDWNAVALRALEWRLKTAVWLVLETADRWIGLPGSSTALARLRPRLPRRVALHSLVSTRGLLSDRDLTRTSRRHVFMLSVVDRPEDAARLIGRAVWPEPWWLAARYGRPVGRVRHLFGLLRRGAA